MVKGSILYSVCKVKPFLYTTLFFYIYNAISLCSIYSILLTCNKRICMKTWSDQVSTVSGP